MVVQSGKNIKTFCYSNIFVECEQDGVDANIFVLLSFNNEPLAFYEV